MNSIYSKRTNLLLGFHGCDESLAKKVVEGEVCLKPSMNDYDWLGNGIYFWENNIERAASFAQEAAKRNKAIKKPAVLGAIIDLGYCMDLLDSEFIKELKYAYNILEETLRISEVNLMPQNGGNSPDKLLRRLDCAVFQMAHAINNQAELPPYDSVRGVFWEGDDLYPGASFKEKSHIQICVRNPNCIKGYFLPKAIDGEYILP